MVDNGEGASAITTNSAVLNGNLTSTGGSPTEVRICWGPTDGGGLYAAWSNVVFMDILPTGSFSASISGLVTNKQYYYRCWASNLTGIAWASATAGFVTDTRRSLVTNVIVFIGDGMGYHHIEAGRYFKGTNLVFEAWPNTGDVKTTSASFPTATDSAAASTAMATGTRVSNKVISVAIPGSGKELQTILEYCKARGKRTGLVTTDYMTEATPAGFGAHVAGRSDTAGIVSNYLSRTRPNVLFGGGGTISVGAAAAAGYSVVTNRDEMLALDTETTTMACGLFGVNGFPYEYDGIGPIPHLSEMTDTALKILDTGTNGFFLMVEGAKIDDSAHAWDTTRCVREIAEFDRAVSNVVAWMSGRMDTLVVVVADHETCVISGVQDNGPGNDPTVQWTVPGHTTNNIGLFACGMNSSVFFGAMQNTNIFYNIVSAYQSGLIDGDMDGMIDSWEIRYFGSTNNPSGAASGDPDGDGRQNLDEFVAGTDPTDGASFFPLEVYRTNSLCNVRFSTVAAAGFDYVGLSRYYDLYDGASTNGPFLPVSGFTNIFGANQAVTNTAADTAKYYRVLIRLP